MNCQNCGKSVKQTPGRRPKQYCSDKCRLEAYQKRKREAHEKAKKEKAAGSLPFIEKDAQNLADQAILRKKIAELEDLRSKDTDLIRRQSEKILELEKENEKLRQKAAKGPSLADVLKDSTDVPEDRAAGIRAIRGGKTGKNG